MMARAVVLDAQGPPEVMALRDIEVGDPGPGEARVRQHAVGLNYIDVYHRNGAYPLKLPSGLGLEGAGVVEAVGDGVAHVRPGDRVAYGDGPVGAYADVRVMPAAPLCRLPDAVGFEDAAAVMLKGLTVHYLFRRTTPIGPGSVVLFHAAAGGVGLLACQWARSEGIRLIATAGSAEKREMALAAGASDAIDYRSGDMAAEVRRLTAGRGVDVVMDGVGRDTWEASLDSLAPLGMMISFGSASGKVPPFDIAALAAKGSLKVTRPTLFAHTALPGVRQEMAGELLAKVAGGEVRARVDQRLPLAEVREAHRALEARETTGSTVLIP